MTATPEELSAEDRLTYLIGQAVQRDIRLEEYLKRLWAHLAGGSTGMASVLIPPRVSTIIDECSTMLKRSPFPETLRAAGAEVLELAKAAHDARDRCAHRYWRRDDDDPDPHAFRARKLTKRTLGSTTESASIKDVETCLVQLRAAFVRVIALDIALFEGDDGPPRTLQEMADWTVDDDVMVQLTGRPRND